jgi:hypothetical protein
LNGSKLRCTVPAEIRTAREVEKKEMRRKLFPIRLGF